MKNTKEKLFSSIDNFLLSAKAFTHLSESLIENGSKLWEQLLKIKLQDSNDYYDTVVNFIKFLYDYDIIPEYILDIYFYDLLNLHYKIVPDTRITPAILYQLSQDEVLLEVLQKTLVINKDTEQFLWKLRQQLLFATFDNQLPDREVLLLMAALAQQCFNNDYLYPETNEEKQIVSKFVARLQNISEEDNVTSLEPILLAVGMYQGYKSLPNASFIADIPLASFTAYVQPVVTRLLLEPLREQAIAANLASFGTLGNGISETVQEQYEEHPYPKWFKLRRMSETIWDKMRNVNPSFSQDTNFDDREIQILVPGCGTGQHPLHIARAHPEAQIVAIDLSGSSLAYAKKKAEEYQIENVKFYKGDLLSISALNQKFHHIDCVGVLHHLKNPIEGWQALIKVLHSRGTMHIGLYSEVARMPVTFFRNKIAEMNVPSTSNGMRNFRKQVMTQKQYHIINKTLQNRDFFSLSGFRDLLFHVQEHRYSVSEIENILEEFNLKFIGFQPGQVRIQYPDMFLNPKTFSSLELWKQLERLYIGTFTLLDFYIQKRGD